MAILDSTIVNGDININGEIQGAYFKDTTSGNNSVSGYKTLSLGKSTTASGDYSMVIGHNSSATGIGAIAIGCTAQESGGSSANGANASGDWCIAIGNGARSGSSCVSIGAFAGYGAGTNYSFCTCIGRGAYKYGANATVIGYQAKGVGVVIGSGAVTTTNTSGSTYSIAIGYNAQGYSGNSYSTRVGASYTSSGRNLMLGAGGTNYTYMNAAGASWTSASDIRDKTDIQEIEHSLDFIKKIHPITYVMNNREDYIIKGEDDKPILDENGKQQYDVEAHERGDKKKHRRFAGVSAQETYQAMIDCYKNDNYAQIVDDNKYDNPDDEYIQQYTVSYERFVPFLIRAIQEQQEQIETLQARLEVLEGYNEEIEKASSEE